ncbi:tetratricopeptide repeat protein [Clostridium diolis]|uniref:tetratricopeptide repeat protein n=1 Tax=Clostridium diolis TaxID=223919 RepID=UPI003AF97396
MKLKKEYFEHARDILQDLLNVSGIISGSIPVKLSALFPKYIFKAMDSAGFFKITIDNEIESELEKLVQDTVESCYEIFDRESFNNFINISLPLIKHELSNSITFQNIPNILFEALNKELLREGKYFTKNDVICIVSIFLEEFKRKLPKYSKINNYIQIKSVDKLISQVNYHEEILNSHESDIAQLKDEQREIKNKIENTVNSEFVFTNGEDISVVNEFIGRSNEIKKLKDEIKKGEGRLLICGMGGIGKTQLCRYVYSEYLNLHKKVNLEKELNGKMDIDHIGYMVYSESMDRTVYRYMKYQSVNNYEEDLKIAWSKLISLANEKRILLFIDNLDNRISKDESINKLYSIQGIIVVTSRYNTYKDFKASNLGYLRDEECIDIFKAHYKHKIEANRLDDLEYVIFNLAAKHTKTIELLAKMSFDQGWAIEELKTSLIEKGFDLSFITDEDETISIQKEYEKLFDLANLSESQINILEAFSLFPYEYLDLEHCNLWLNEDAQISECSQMYNILYRMGWLENNNNKYGIHPVIAQTIYNNRLPGTNKHANLLEKCARTLNVKDSDKKNYAVPYLEFGVSIIRNIKERQRTEISHLALSMAYLFSFQYMFKDSFEYYEIALETIKSIYGKNSLEAIYIYYYRGLTYDRCSKYKEAIEDENMALNLYKEFNVNDLKLEIRIYNAIGIIYSNLGLDRKALEIFSKSLQLNNEINNEQGAYLIANNMAISLMNLGDYEGVIDIYQQLKDRLNRFYCDENNIYFETYYNTMGIAYGHMGKYNESLLYLLKTLDIQNNIYSENHAQIASTYLGISNNYYCLELYDKASIFTNKALKIYLDTVGENHHDVILTYNSSARIFNKLYNYNEAIKYAQRSIELGKEILGEEHPDLTECYAAISDSYIGLGKYENAIFYRNKSLKINKNIFGNESLQVGLDYNYIANLNFSNYNYEQALKFCLKAYNIFTQIEGLDSIHSKDSFCGIERCYRALGNDKKNFSKWMKKHGILEEAYTSEAIK